MKWLSTIKDILLGVKEFANKWGVNKVIYIITFIGVMELLISDKKHNTKLTEQNSAMIEQLINLQNVNEKYHQEQFNRRLEVNTIINEELETFRDKHNLDRIFICEIHNGGQSITGIPFCKFSMTYEVVGNNISPFKHNYQNVNISNYSIVGEIIKDEYLHIDIDALKNLDKHLYYSLQDYKVKCLELILIKDDNQPIAWVGFSYSDECKNSINKDIIILSSSLKNCLVN